MAVAVIISDYFHDVATAMLLASGVLLWLIERRYAADGPGAGKAALLPLERQLHLFGAAVAAWLLAGGALRVAGYERYERAQALANGVLPGLRAKQALMIAALVAGIALWARLLLGLRSFRRASREEGGR